MQWEKVGKELSPPLLLDTTFSYSQNSYNYGNGVRGISNFVNHNISTEVDKYITRTHEQMALTPPSRYLNFLDIRTMFNKISRERALDIVQNYLT